MRSDESKTTRVGTHDFATALAKGKEKFDETKAAGTLFPVNIEDVRAKKWLPSPFPTSR